MSIRTAVLATGLLALLLAGCSNPRTLRVDDDASLAGTVRALHRFGGVGQGGGGVEVEAHAVRGKATQVLDNFDTVTLGGRSIPGPGVVSNRARAQHLQLVYNHLLFQGRPVELEWFAGATVAQLRWDTTSTNPAHPALSYRRSWYGPAGGIAARVRLVPGLALEARYAGAIEYRRILGAARESAEVVLAWNPVPALQLRAGMGETRVNVDDELDASDLSLRVRGPFAGLTLSF